MRRGGHRRPLETLRAPELCAVAAPVVIDEEWERFTKLYRQYGPDVVRGEYTVEALRKLARLHGIELGSARTKAAIIEVMMA